MLLCTTLLSAQLADFGHTTPVGTFIMRGAPRMKWDWLLRNLDLPAQMLANFSSDLVSRKTTLAKVAENLSPCPSFSTDCALWDPGCLKQYGLCVLRFQHVGKCLGIDYSNANYFWMFLQHPQDKVQISYMAWSLSVYLSILLCHSPPNILRYCPPGFQVIWFLASRVQWKWSLTGSSTWLVPPHLLALS